MIHLPVLQKEVLEYLGPKPNQNFIDCTIGEGGHSLAILEKILPNGRVLGIEWDLELYQKLLKLDIDRLILVNDSFTNLNRIVEKEKFRPVSGILFDLGLSSWHLEESGRGFSFLRNEPLDMRYDKNSKFKINPTGSRKRQQNSKLTAEKIVNEWPQAKIQEILKEYGEERFAKKISEKIVKEREIKPIKTTFQLVEVIKKAVPAWYQGRKGPRRRRGGRRVGGVHFATKTFQALRITVNDELNNLKKALPQAIEILKPGGRLAVISFHSLEDRIVKNFFREESKKGIIRILTKKPVRPNKGEIKINPRSRSAKLRAASKI